MRLLRGPYLVLVGILAVVIGAAVGVLWLPRAQPAPDRAQHAAHYHEQAGINRELEPIFQKMDAALVKALARHNPVCDGPGGGCTAKSDPGVGVASSWKYWVGKAGGEVQEHHSQCFEAGRGSACIQIDHVLCLDGRAAHLKRAGKTIPFADRRGLPFL